MDEVVSRTALLAGATGAVGRFCLEYLLESPRYSKIVVLTRSPLKFDNPKMQKYQIDFDRINDYKELFGVDDIFCSLGLIAQKASSKEEYYKVDVSYPYQMAQLAITFGAKRYFLVSSIGANSQSRFFYWKMKGEAERRILSLPFKSVRIFRPALIIGPRKEFRLNEFLAILLFKIFSFLFVGKASRFKPMYAKDIARAMVRSAMDDRAGVHIYESSDIRSISR